MPPLGELCEGYLGTVSISMSNLLQVQNYFIIKNLPNRNKKESQKKQQYAGASSHELFIWYSMISLPVVSASSAVFFDDVHFILSISR